MIPLIRHFAASATARLPTALWPDDPSRIDPLHDRWWLLWRRDDALREAVLWALARDWPPLIARAIDRSGVEGSAIKKAVVAALVGRHRSTLHRIERGEIPIHLDALYALASLLGIEARDLLPESVAEWVGRVSARVCAGGVGDGEPRVYAEYMWIKSERGQLPRLRREARIDPEIVREVVARPCVDGLDGDRDEARVAAAVERVARRLREKLAHLKPGG